MFNIDLSKMNRDQAFSLLNHMIAIAGTMLATQGGLADDTQMLVVGILATVGSLGLSMWFNVDNLADMATSSFRKLIMIGGTYATARGYIDAEMMAKIAGPLLMGAMLVWSQFFYRDAPGPNLAGTTIVDPPATIS